MHRASGALDDLAFPCFFVEAFAAHTNHELTFCGGSPSSRGIVLSSAEDADASFDLAVGATNNLSAVLMGLAERSSAYRIDRWPTLFDLARAGAYRNDDCEPTKLVGGRPAFWTAVRDRAVTEQLRLLQVEAQDARARAGTALTDLLLAETPYRFHLTAEATKGTDAQALGAYLRQNSVKTVLGDLSWDEKGELTHADYIWYVWRDGKPWRE